MMHLLLAIARAVDETGACRFVTKEALAASCACAARQVRRLVGELADERYLPTADAGAAVAAERRICTCCREAREPLLKTAMSGLVENRGKPDI
jgi:hypothetical protein